MSKELQSAVETHAKRMIALKKSMAAIPKITPPKKSIELPDKMVKELKDLQASYAALTKTVDTIVAANKKIGPAAVKNYKSMMTKVNTGLAKAIKSYQSAVKNSDGMTSLRPATVKALQTVSKLPATKTREAAYSELDKHVADIKKQNGKDKSKAKAVAAFEKAVGAIKADLAAL